MAGLVAKRTLGNLSRLPWWADQGETTGKQSGSTCVFSCCSPLSPFRPASLQLWLLGPWNSRGVGTGEFLEHLFRFFPPRKQLCQELWEPLYQNSCWEHCCPSLQTNLLDKLRTFRVYVKFEGLWNVPVTIGEIAKQDSSSRVQGSHCGWEEPQGVKKKNPIVGGKLGKCLKQSTSAEHGRLQRAPWWPWEVKAPRATPGRWQCPRIQRHTSPPPAREKPHCHVLQAAAGSTRYHLKGNNDPVLGFVDEETPLKDHILSYFVSLWIRGLSQTQTISSPFHGVASCCALLIAHWYLFLLSTYYLF